MEERFQSLRDKEQHQKKALEMHQKKETEIKIKKEIRKLHEDKSAEKVARKNAY